MSSKRQCFVCGAWRSWDLMGDASACGADGESERVDVCRRCLAGLEGRGSARIVHGDMIYTVMVQRAEQKQR